MARVGVGDAFCRVRGKSQSRFLAAEAVWNDKPLNFGRAPRLWKTGGYPVPATG